MTELVSGRCTCGQVRYRLNRAPLFVHCCHCRWCQRETGSAFVINALVEAEHVEVTRGEPARHRIPSESGRGQLLVRCPECRVVLWSHYSSEKLACVRVGTLEEPDTYPPDVHIFTMSRQPWVVIPEGAPVFEEYYDYRELWPPESLERVQALRRG